MARKRIDLETAGHLIAAAVLLLKGFDKLDHGHVGIGLTLLASGAILVAFFAYVLRTGRGQQAASALVLLLEALAMALITYFFFEEGKQFVQYATMLAAVMYLFAFVRTLVKSKQHGIRLNDITTGTP
jgi:hypothetical protein